MIEESKNRRLLLVDDDDTFRRVMASELSRRGYVVTTAANGAEAVKQFGRSGADVTILDLRLPDMTGIDVLARLREQDPDAGVVVLTGHGTIDTAIQAIRLGAHDYLEKPCPIEKLEMTVDRTCEHMRLVKRHRILEDGYSAPDVAPGLVGESPAFKGLLKKVARVARTDVTTLILGETGVGKELVATLLHAQSERHEAPFVVVDCAGLHEQLLQSELFGHEKGAFTGAARQKHGLFEVANGGTLLLDEVGEASPEIQAQLLRVLETGRFRRLGGNREITVDVRILAATNRDLAKAISRGHFREDLFYRLATLTLRIPPLRERGDDIRLLAENFARQFNLRFSRTRRFTPDALEALMRHDWPGNVRELIHVVEQAFVLGDGETIGLHDLPESITGRREPVVEEAAETILPLREVERRHVLSVLDAVGGNRARAAELLRISERNLYRLLGKYRRRGEG